VSAILVPGAEVCALVAHIGIGAETRLPYESL
jgi:hypothetical protein